MAKKSGLSHGLAAVLALVVGKIFVGYLSPHFPRVTAWLEDHLRAGVEWVAERVPFEFSRERYLPFLVAFVLAFAWGVLYHYARGGGGDD